jgi:tetratricopeptide (TPR) repeat protein
MTLAAALAAGLCAPMAYAQSSAQPHKEPGAPAAREPDRSAKSQPSSASSALRKPRTPAQKARILSDLYERLSAADNSENAEVLAGTIEQLWLYSGSDTVNLLMERSLKALSDKKVELSLKILDGIVALRPDYAEAWNRRAYVHFSQKDFGRAMADLQQVLALEPRHFKAISGLATIMREFGQKAGALKAYRKLLEIHPFWSDAEQAVRELEREVEGDNI